MTKQVKDDGMPWISPMLTVQDVDASLKFYAEAFGFEPGGTMPDDDGNTNYANMMYKGQMVLMMMPEKSWGNDAVTPNTSATPTPVSLYVYCDDVDARYAQAKKTGATVLEEPADMFWGDRLTRLQDPDGHVWSFAIKVADYQPESAVPA